MAYVQHWDLNEHEEKSEKELQLEQMYQHILDAKQKRVNKDRIKRLAVGPLLAQLRNSSTNPELGDENQNKPIAPPRSPIRQRSFMMAPNFGPLDVLVKEEMVRHSILDKPWLLEQVYETAAAPPHPTDIPSIQRLVRQKMPRCKICRNRFGERFLIEVHMRECHPEDYEEYVYEMEKTAFDQRKEEMERNRAEKMDYQVDDIPLPGELDIEGKASRFVDKWGSIFPKKIRTKKKVSPQCPRCDKRLRNDSSLKKHIIKKHPDVVNFTQCRQCFKVFGTKTEQEQHDCDLSFLCFECTPIRNLYTAIRLATHRAKFHRGRDSGFKCADCSLKFLTPRKLRKHRKMTHVFTRTYHCHFCDEIFISEIAVTTHERIHTGIIKFECQICDYRCGRYQEMERHKQEEHGWRCAICKDTFAEWNDLKNHTMHSHGGYLTNEAMSSSYIESPRVWLMFKGE
ncbi:unnamed protein product, partial [Mesorhabditis spiculigera]